MNRNRSRILKYSSFILALLLLSQLLLSATAASESSQATGGEAGARPHVVMISIDGLVPDYYLTPDKFGLRIPNLRMLKMNGAYANSVEGVYPTVTYPVHTAMVTGTTPAVSGIYNNRIFEDPRQPPTRAWYWYAKDIKSEPLWTAAKRAGLTTAAVSWPVTVGADIDYNVPEVWDPKDMNQSMPVVLAASTRGLIEELQQTAPLPLTNRFGDDTRTLVAEFIIKRYRPNLLLLHLADLDSAQHTHGPFTAEAYATLEKTDAQVGQIIEATKQAGIYDQTSFIIVSDHGFMKIEKQFNPGVALSEAGLIKIENGKVVDWKATVWTSGGSAAIVLRDEEDKETANQVTEIFNRLANASRSPLWRVLDREKLKQIGANPQAFLMLDAAPLYVMGERLSGPLIEDLGKDRRGTHGYLPTRSEMRASLILSGRNVRVGTRIPLTSMLNIGPTAAALLGITLEKAQGSPLSELLKPGIIPPKKKQKAESEKRTYSGVYRT